MKVYLVVYEDGFYADDTHSVHRTEEGAQKGLRRLQESEAKRYNDNQTWRSDGKPWSADDFYSFRIREWDLED